MICHGTIITTAVFKQPYRDDFLRFCIHHFKLGIWSSRLGANYFPCISLSRPVYIVLPRGDNYDIFFIYNRANVDAVVNFLI